MYYHRRLAYGELVHTSVFPAITVSASSHVSLALELPHQGLKITLHVFIHVRHCVHVPLPVTAAITSLHRPNTGRTYFEEKREDLLHKYSQIDSEAAGEDAPASSSCGLTLRTTTTGCAEVVMQTFLNVSYSTIVTFSV